MKLLFAIFIGFIYMLPSKAQDKQERSINEIKLLLQKAKADTDRINLLFEAASYYITRDQRDQSAKKDADSALYYLNAATKLPNTLNNLIWKARSLYIYSGVYRKSGNKEKGKNCILSAITILNNYDYKTDLANAYIELGNYYDAFSDSEVVYKIDYYEKAKQLYSKAGNKMRQAATLKDLADFHQLQYKDSLALQELKQSLAIFQSISYPKIQGVYDLMGYILYNAGDYKQALKYGLLAVQTAQKANCTSAELSTIYNRVGLIYYKLMQFDEAVKYFKVSSDIAMANHDTVSVFIIAPNVANSYLRLEKPLELIAYLKSLRNVYAVGSTGHKISYTSNIILAYLQMNKQKEASPYVEELIKMSANQTNMGTYRTLYRTLLPYYLASGSYKEMYKYLTANEKICIENNITSGLSDNYLWWFKADSALKNYTGAIEHYKLYKQASDSALHVANNQQIDQLLVSYESEKKDQAIALNKKNIQLLTSQSKLQQTQLQQTRLVKNLTFGGIILLLIIIGLLFRVYWFKQKNNKHLQAQQKEINQQNRILQQTIEEKNNLLEEKEWLVKEIHHRVKNNLQIVISLLSTQSKYLDNEEAIAAISESRHRMQAMSLIHQKLYQSENTTLVNMQTYITELSDYLKTSFNNGKAINFLINVDEVLLDISQAIPIGLILNEVITNAIKYAFEGREAGNIQIKMLCIDGNKILLGIKDNGVGLPDDFNIQTSDSMGMRLMKGLVKQINGNLFIENDSGVKLVIDFKAETTLKNLMATA